MSGVSRSNVFIGIIMDNGQSDPNSYPKAWKAGMERAQCIERKRSLEADSQM